MDMKTLALGVLLLAGCASNTIPRPACWIVKSEVGQGSAVPIRKTGNKLWLLTAKHNLPMLTADGHLIVDQIRHPKEDVALISVYSTSYLVPIAEKDAELGDRLYAAGWQGESLLITSGYKGSEPGRMSCPIFYGASGGPVWNSRGELVGLVKGIWRYRNLDGNLYPVPHISLYVSVVDLRSWIDKHAK